MLLISTFKDVSTVDVLNSTSCIIFLPYCNLKCPWCQNTSIVKGEIVRYISEDEIKEFIEDVSRLVEYVQVSGGEPTLHPRTVLKIFSIARRYGLKTSLNTNGTNPNFIRELIKLNLLDHLAVDVKHRLEDRIYWKAVGVEVPNITQHILNTIATALNSNVLVEVRTTVIPSLHTFNDIKSIVLKLNDVCYGTSNLKYVLQQFTPPEKPFNMEFLKVPTLTVDELKRLALKLRGICGFEIYIRTISGVFKVV